MSFKSQKSEWIAHKYFDTFASNFYLNLAQIKQTKLWQTDWIDWTFYSVDFDNQIWQILDYTS